MKQRKINQELLDLLRSGRWNDFSVSELKAAYMELPNCKHRTEKGTWQFVYRNVIRMESRGLIKAIRTVTNGRARYCLNLISESAPEGLKSSDVHAVSEDETMSCLKEKLHRYKVEMLTAIGETEEYDSLCKELPHLCDGVQVLYNEARDRCSKILGRVKALESILAHHLSATS